jgi:tetratricopeptide (TPR) repeat protein
MIRACMAAVVVLLLLAGRPAAAQDDDAWKGLVIQALYAASARDYVKSEQVFQKAVQEAERFGPEDPRVGTTLNSIGLVYRAEKKFTEAETSFRKALAILQKTYGTDSIDVANVNFNIASAMFEQGHQQPAVPYLQKTLVTYENVLGGSSLKTASVLCMLGDAHRLAHEFPAAETSLKRCADIRESNGGMQNNDLADALNSLALTYMAEGKLGLAEPRFTLAEKIREKTLGITSPVLAQTFEDHAFVLRQMGKDLQAEKLSTMAAAIRRSAKPEMPVSGAGKDTKK